MQLIDVIGAGKVFQILITFVLKYEEAFPREYNYNASSSFNGIYRLGILLNAFDLQSS